MSLGEGLKPTATDSHRIDTRGILLLVLYMHVMRSGVTIDEVGGHSRVRLRLVRRKCRYQIISYQKHVLFRSFPIINGPLLLLGSCRDAFLVRQGSAYQRRGDLRRDTPTCSQPPDEGQRHQLPAVRHCWKLLCRCVRYLFVRLPSSICILSPLKLHPSRHNPRS